MSACRTPSAAWQESSPAVPTLPTGASPREFVVLMFMAWILSLLWLGGIGSAVADCPESTLPSDLATHADALEAGIEAADTQAVRSATTDLEQALPCLAEVPDVELVERVYYDLAAGWSTLGNDARRAIWARTAQEVDSNPDRVPGVPVDGWRLGQCCLWVDGRPVGELRLAPERMHLLQWKAGGVGLAHTKLVFGTGVGDGLGKALAPTSDLRARYLSATVATGPELVIAREGRKRVRYWRYPDGRMLPAEKPRLRIGHIMAATVALSGAAALIAYGVHGLRNPPGGDLEEQMRGYRQTNLAFFGAGFLAAVGVGILVAGPAVTQPIWPPE